MTRTRTRTAAGLIAALAAAGLVGTPSATASAPAPTGASTTATTTSGRTSERVPDDVRLVSTRHSLLGTHRLYQQVRAGRTVAGGYFLVHDWAGRTLVDDLRRTITATKAPASAADVTAAEAVSAADPRGQVLERRQVWLVDKAGTARLVWQVTSLHGATRTITSVDAGTAAVVRVSRDPLGHKTAPSRTFAPNPIVKLQDQSLTDDDDANSAVPGAAYTQVTLEHLNNGSDTLTGRWVRIVNEHKATANDEGAFLYRRENNSFEQVVAYHSIDVVQTYFHELGFDDANAESQKIETNTFSGDNSFYEPSLDKITMGSGGVDDGEDEEIVWHEYGHAVQDAQVPGWGVTEQGGAMGEGFGDYLAFTMSQADSPATPIAPRPCIGDWDSISYTSDEPHCLRRVDGTKTFPDDMEGEVHADGEIWSRALFDVNKAIGRTHANTAIIEGQFLMSPRSKFVGAARRIVQATDALYGTEEAAQVRGAFVARGILAARVGANLRGGSAHAAGRSQPPRAARPACVQTHIHPQAGVGLRRRVSRLVSDPWLPNPPATARTRPLASRPRRGTRSPRSCRTASTRSTTSS